jgi:class 3 adenylate cyclase/pimeloyl-ACP methyl ester carboxylesterase
VTAFWQDVAVVTGDVDDREPVTTTVTVLFCDLVSSTERGQLLGDDEADQFRRAFFARMNEAVAATRGEVVKNTGDGLMVVFRDSAVSAVTCAATMHDKVEALDVDPPAFIRIGISAGEVAEEDNDYFGTPVVEAARLCAAAGTGQTLVSDVVRALVGTRGGHQFRSVGTLTLKGLSEPLATAALVRAPVIAPKPVPVPRARPRSRWLYVAGATAVVLIAAAVGVVIERSDNTKKAAVAPAAAAGYTPRVAPAACEQQFKSVARDVVCGTLSVPEDRKNPQGRWIQLEYRRYPATVGKISDRTVVDVGDPSFPSPTGTGTGGGDLDTSGSGRFMVGLGGADFVVVASRGLYRSTPSLDCPEFDAVAPDVVAHAQGDLAIVARGQQALRACYSRLVRSGLDPAHFRLDDQAADVVDLIHALQLHSVDLAAGNDGAIIAFRVASMVPDAIRSLALVNPAAPQESFRSDSTASLATVFERYVSLCQADAQCRKAYPDLAVDYASVFRRYSAHPVTVKASSGLANPGQLMNVPVRLDGGHTAQGLAAAFEGDAAALPLIPQGIEHPNDDLDAQLAASEEYPLLLPHFPCAGFLARLCNNRSMARIINADASQLARPEFAGYDDPAFEWMCAAWPIPLLNDNPSPAAGVPVFVARNDLSPRQSMNALSEIRTANPSAQVFEMKVPTPSGVLGFFPQCYSDLRAAFERDPTAPLDTASCEKHEATIAFVTPSG